MTDVFAELVLHARTRDDLTRFVGRPSHSLLLIGMPGAGKATLARAVVAAVLNDAYDKLSGHGKVRYIAPTKGTIPIEAIRGAQDFVRLKTTGTAAFRRALLLEDAHGMTVEAQNAFLKLLEEPPADTLIVMTAVGRESLLPTILSRTQKVTVKPPLQADLTVHFAEQGTAAADIVRAYHLSKGQAGLMSDLVAGAADSDLLQSIDTAKRILQTTPFERLAMVDALAKKKDTLPQLLWAMQRVCDAAMYNAAQKHATKQVAHWRSVLAAVLDAQEGLRRNAQPKLLLTNLLLSL